MPNADWSKKSRLCSEKLRILERDFGSNELRNAFKQDGSAKKMLPEKHTSQGGKGRRYLSGSDWTQYLRANAIVRVCVEAVGGVRACSSRFEARPYLLVVEPVTCTQVCVTSLKGLGET